MIKKIIMYIRWILVDAGIFNFMSDELYLKMTYKFKFGKKLNLDNPQTYNEKLQWLKINDRKAIYTTMVDKYEVKKYVANIIGKEYIIPTLGIWDNFDDIDFEKLPNRFVLKCTHDSGGIVICKNKDNFNIMAARKKIEKSLKRNYYYIGREWPYKNVKPRIIAEEYIEENEEELKDYKFFCFDGKVKALFIATDRNSKNETCFDFFDEKFNHLNITNGHPNSAKKIEKPKEFDKMKELAEKLTQKMIHARVDFYNISGQIYFGEITLYHWSGMVPFEPKEWDNKLGEMIKLPKNIREDQR